MTNDQVYDITIIGGGPAGLFAAYCAGLRGATVKIIESLPELGGQLTALYPHKYIYDVPGFRKVMARDFVERQLEQTMSYNPAIFLDETATLLWPEGENGDLLYELWTNRGNVHRTRTVIVAAGAGAFIPRTLDIPDVHRLEDRGVYYYVRDPEQFRGKRVLIVGGGDSAVDWALALQEIAGTVTLIHRRDRFRACENTAHELLDSPCTVLLHHELVALDGYETVTGATVADNRSGATTQLEIDAVILGLGFIANLGPIRDWGITIQKNAIEVDGRMATNLPGVYAVGDIAHYEGKLKLIGTATAEAAIAAHYAKNYLDPTATMQPVHSSTLVHTPSVPLTGAA